MNNSNISFTYVVVCFNQQKCRLANSSSKKVVSKLHMDVFVVTEMLVLAEYLSYKPEDGTNTTLNTRCKIYPIAVHAFKLYRGKYFYCTLCS